jgi:hypothetical protein
MQPVLHTDLGTVASTVRHVLRMVKGHQGEIAVGLVKQVLETYGIRCGHNGKVNAFINLLCRWDLLLSESPSPASTQHTTQRNYFVGSCSRLVEGANKGDMQRIAVLIEEADTERNKGSRY